MDRSILLHATSLVIDRFGVLIRGASGSGKSELARALIGRSSPERHRALIADDQTRLEETHGALIASCPKPIQGKMEWRGVGIIDIAPIAAARIDLVVDLLPADDIQRLPEAGATTMLEGITLPLCIVWNHGTAAEIVERSLQHHADRGL